MNSESSLIIHMILAGSECTVLAPRVPLVLTIHFEHIYHSSEHLYCVDKDSEFG